MDISFGILGTYPPTQCGIATFNQSLVQALRQAGATVEVVSVLDGESTVPADVAHAWLGGTDQGPVQAAAALNRTDIALIQHEYGIYPGTDGAAVLEVSRALEVPVISVLHTVLSSPSPSQRQIIENLARDSTMVVTMTHTARQRLVDHYAVDPATIAVIPHGAPESRPVDDRESASFPLRPAILTWGLLGPGKGIEWAIEAMSLPTDLHPLPHYYIVGGTHPRVLERSGERYRSSLMDRVHELGLESMVHFDPRYLDSTELNRVVRDADSVLLPYDSEEQVTSGVLIEAVSAGKPVVATAFPHAVEVLADGAGLLTNRMDPVGLAAALRRVLTEPGLAATMSTAANRIAPTLRWPVIADAYRALAVQILQHTDLLASA